MQSSSPSSLFSCVHTVPNSFVFITNSLDDFRNVHSLRSKYRKFRCGCQRIIKDKKSRYISRRSGFLSSRLEALTLLEHPVSLREQFLRDSELFIVQFTDLVVFGRNRRRLVVVRVDLVHELLFGPGHLVVVEATVLGRRFMDHVTDTDRGMSLGIGVAERFNHTNLVWIFVNDIVHIYNIENPDEVVNLLF